MAKRRRRRRTNFAGIFIKTLIVVLIIAGLLYYGKGFVKQKVENKVAETIVTQMAGSDASLPNGKSAKEVYGSMADFLRCRAEEIKGTKTEQNLLAAFAGESQARNKYTYFASKAKKDGYVQIGNIFQETADNEKEHVNGIGSLSF